MISLRKSQTGVSAVFILVLIVVIAAIGLVAYRVKTANNSSQTASQSAAVVAAPAKIKTKADLSSAAQALQALPIGSDLNPNQLNGNIKSLL